jgi:hypothetical protein
MIVVFVIDTSPSMGRPLAATASASTSAAEAASDGDGMTLPSSGRSMTRLDVAKMAVEDLSRRLRKGVTDHQRLVTNPSNEIEAAVAKSLSNLGQGATRDVHLLLTTSRQYPDTTSCAAGGRLLVGFGVDDIPVMVRRPASFASLTT